MSLQTVPNLAAKVVRRLMSLHKPFVRAARRRAREAEQRAFREEALAVDREMAGVAASSGPIVIGPWLAEVGYEVLYWLPLVRWFADRHGVTADRLIAVSRGGVSDWYADVAGSYVDILDIMTPEQLSDRNRSRQLEDERGGQKQTVAGALDRDILAVVGRMTGAAPGALLHPSLLFRLFRHVWYGNLPLDFLWSRTHYQCISPGQERGSTYAGLPESYAAVKFYAGTALPLTDENHAMVRALVRRLAARMPVVSLDADLGVDEHRDFDLAGIPNVISARPLMTPRDNLAVQSRILQGAKLYAGTCGGLAWLAPFLGVPTAAIFADDQLLGTHLMIARLAGRRVGGADFATLDLRALQHLDVLSTVAEVR